jgi:hypothetical protein
MNEQTKANWIVSRDKISVKFLDIVGQSWKVRKIANNQNMHSQINEDLDICLDL